MMVHCESCKLYIDDSFSYVYVQDERKYRVCISCYNNFIDDNVYRYVSKQQRYEVMKRQKWNCNLCHCKLKYGLDSNWKGEIAHIDHIHPFSKKGDYVNGAENINEGSNLQALCPKCNLGKKDNKIN